MYLRPRNFRASMPCRNCNICTVDVKFEATISKRMLKGWLALSLFTDSNTAGCPLDIYLLIDSSGSIGNSTFHEQVKPFARMLVDAIDDVSAIRAGGSRVAVTSFSDRRDQLLNITAGGSLTAVTAAIGMSDARVSMWKISLTIAS